MNFVYKYDTVNKQTRYGPVKIQLFIIIYCKQVYGFDTDLFIQNRMK